MFDDEGKKLYEFYSDAMDSLNTEVDDWDDLDYKDQWSWDAAANLYKKSIETGGGSYV